MPESPRKPWPPFVLWCAKKEKRKKKKKQALSPNLTRAHLISLYHSNFVHTLKHKLLLQNMCVCVCVIDRGVRKRGCIKCKWDWQRNWKRSGERESEMVKKRMTKISQKREWVVLNECKVLMKDKLMSETGAVRASCSPATTCDPACHSHSIAMTIIVMLRPGGGDKPVLVTNRTPPLSDANKRREDCVLSHCFSFTHTHTHTRSRHHPFARTHICEHMTIPFTNVWAHSHQDILYSHNVPTKI